MNDVITNDSNKQSLVIPDNVSQAVNTTSFKQNIPIVTAKRDNRDAGFSAY